MLDSSAQNPRKFSTAAMNKHAGIRQQKHRKRQRLVAALAAAVLFILCFVNTNMGFCHAWEWSDLVTGTSTLFGDSASPTTPGLISDTFSIHDVSTMRVRDIKRRLTRTHGFTAEEVAVMIDKKDLIRALSFEEEKARLVYEDAMKRQIMSQGVVVSIVAILFVLFFPLLKHAWEVIAVNFVVYTDRKLHEASRCWELKSKTAFVGIGIMAVLDVLQTWLTASIFLSWVMTSKYFFPIPSLPIRPAQLMGGQMAQSAMAGYGINIGSMVVTWGMRYIYRKVEGWTGRALSSAHHVQRKEARAWESREDRAARKAAKRQAKLERQQRREAATTAASNPTPPPEWAQQQQQSMSGGNGGMPPPSSSAAHESFIDSLTKDDTLNNDEDYTNSNIDDLD